LEGLSQFHNSAASITAMNVLQHSNSVRIDYWRTRTSVLLTQMLNWHSAAADSSNQPTRSRGWSRTII